MIRILGIGGSPRRGGNTDILLQNVLKGASNQNSAVKEIHLRDYQFHSCIGCEQCRKAGRCTGLDDDMQRIYPIIDESKGLVVISPVHNYNMTALTKAFVDRLYCYYEFGKERPGKWTSRLAGQGRKAIIAAVGEQPDYEEGGMKLTLKAMELHFEALGYEIVGKMPVLGVFSKGKIRNCREELHEAERLGKQLVKKAGEQ